jgi:hypothetical protein
MYAKGHGWLMKQFQELAGQVAVIEFSGGRWDVALLRENFARGTPWAILGGIEYFRDVLSHGAFLAKGGSEFENNFCLTPIADTS